MVLSLAIAAVGACAPTTEASPTTSPSVAASATASASPRATAAGGLGAELRVPLEAGVSPANVDTEALLVTRRLIDGRTTRVEAVELRTGAVTPVHETVDASVTVPSIRDGVVTLLETQETDVPMTYRMRVLAGRWRDPGTLTQLDEFTVAFVGGDSWKPYPDPQTNGWEVAWLHATAAGTFELRLRDANGGVQTIYTSTVPFSFALGRDGDVAIADVGVAGPPAPPPALRLYSGGAVRTLLERTASPQGGYVAWQQSRIVWANGLGLVEPILTVDRIVPGAIVTKETVALPADCFSYAGVAAGLIAFQCGDHIQLEGGRTIGPPTPQLHALAIVLADGGVARVFPASVDQPRPGAGAHF